MNCCNFFKDVKDLKIKIKSIIVLSLILLSILFIDWNFGFLATNPENEASISSDARSNLIRNEDFDWGSIEVFSEPIIGQDFNIGNSYWPEVAVEGNVTYAVWGDNNNTNSAGTDYDIFFRYFDGSKWSEIQVISEPVFGQDINIGDSFEPSIAVENGKIYVIWTDLNNTNGAGSGDCDIFYRCNLTGKGWEDIQVISEPISGLNLNIEYSVDPEIVVENDKIYVVWNDNNNTIGADTDGDIFYKSNLTGSSWEDVQVISEPVPGQNFNTGHSQSVDVAVENGKIYAVWYDDNNTNGAGLDWDIFYRCNLTGSGWEDIQVISEPIFGQDNNVDESQAPAIAVENGKIYVVWEDENNTNEAGTDKDIFFRCNLTGSSWEPVQVISEPIFGNNINIDWSDRPSIAIINGKIYVVWQDNTTINGAGTDWDIFYRYNLTGYSWEGIQIISEPFTGMNYNTGVSTYPDIAVNFNKSHIVWFDSNNTNGAGTDYDIFYRWTYIALVLSLPKVTPVVGNTNTYFNFTVTYHHVKNKAPEKINVRITGINYSMLEVDPNDMNYLDGKDYFFNITHLNIGVHSYQFWASDGNYIKFTKLVNKPEVYNTPPNITTEDNSTAIEDLYYKVSYEYEDIDLANVGQLGYWDSSTNASWLAFNQITAILNGTPMNDDVGSYWVNISINDTMDMDYTNFTLTVININDNPMINTNNIEFTYEDELYEVDYNATDIDSPLGDQIWSLSTNASSWLDIDSATGIISGTPTNDDVGDYWVNVSVEDGDDGLAYTNYTLIVLNVNDRPEIITDNELIANANVLYKVDYNATDIDSPLSQFAWSLNTNATWLDVVSNTGILSGTPTNSDVGWYNINITVDDGDGGHDWHEFILSVITEGFENEPPKITTIDKVSITAGELYNIVYEATDDRTPVESLIWSYNSNASWLSFSKSTRLLSGIPTLSHVGWYWVNVTVNDGEDGWDWHVFNLRVIKEPVDENNVPILSDPTMSPSEGDTETEFTFTVHYYDLDNDAPTFILVVIDNKSYNMTLTSGDPSNGTYAYSTKLSEGTHTYYFTASDGINTVSTDNFTVDIKKPGKISEEELSWWWLILLIILIIIVILITIFVITRRKRRRKEEQEQEQLTEEEQLEE